MLFIPIASLNPKRKGGQIFIPITKPAKNGKFLSKNPFAKNLQKEKFVFILPNAYARSQKAKNIVRAENINGSILPLK